MGEETEVQRGCLLKVTTDDTWQSWDSNVGRLASESTLLITELHSLSTLESLTLEVSSRHESYYWIEDPMVGSLGPPLSPGKGQ